MTKNEKRQKRNKKDVRRFPDRSHSNQCFILHYI